MDTKQVNIAVQVSGLIRYWDATYPLLEYWNSLFENVKFTFFISTWNNLDVWYDKDKHNADIIDNPNLDDFNFVAKWAKHDSNEVKLVIQGKNSPSCWFSYMFKKVTELRNKYEKENNITFDGVIQTRNDIFISKELLEYVSSVVRSNKYYYNRDTIFCSGNLHLLGKGDKRNLLLGDDNFCFGHPKCIDDCSTLYDDIIIKEEYDNSNLHFIRGEHLIKLKKQVISIHNPFFLFREKEVATKREISPTKMLNLISTRGVEWVFNESPTDLVDNFLAYN